MNEIIWRIKSKYGDLRKSEKKSADYILEHLEEVDKLSIEKLAKRCEVSEPTIMRLVKALGYQGYSEFRYAIISAKAKGKGKDETADPLYGFSLSSHEQIKDIPEKISSISIQNIEESMKCISVKTFEKVIDAIKNARVLDIYSVENSNVVAIDLLTKLLYIGIPCRHFDDYYHQKISAGNLTKEDVAIGISYSGYSKDTVDIMRTAKKSGATTIVLTNFKDSAICKYADLLLCTTQKQFFYGDSIFSRTTQLMIIDMIYMGIIASDYKRYTKQLDKSGRIVGDKAYLPET